MFVKILCEFKKKLKIAKILSSLKFEIVGFFNFSAEIISIGNSNVASYMY